MCRVLDVPVATHLAMPVSHLSWIGYGQTQDFRMHWKLMFLSWCIWTSMQCIQNRKRNFTWHILRTDIQKYLWYFWGFYEHFLCIYFDRKVSLVLYCVKIFAKKMLIKSIIRTACIPNLISMIMTNVINKPTTP